MWSWPRATADPACPRLKEGRTDGPSRAHGQFTEPVEKPSKRMEFQTAHRLYSTDVTSSNGTGRLCTLTYLWVQHHRTSQNITEHTHLTLRAAVRKAGKSKLLHCMRSCRRPFPFTSFQAITRAPHTTSTPPKPSLACTSAPAPAPAGVPLLSCDISDRISDPCSSIACATSASGLQYTASLCH